MAFHGSRGSSRARGSSSNGSRGRGGVRVGSRGGSRGSARGRGGFRGGRGRAIFDSARLAQQQDQKSEESGSDDESPGVEDQFEADDDDDTSADEHDIEVLPTTHPYVDLMQALSSHSGSQAKRRKLDHQPNKHEDSNKRSDQAISAEDTDQVDEAEEDLDISRDEVLGDPAEDLEDQSDPFEIHFANPDDNILARKLKSIQQQRWTTRKILISNVGTAMLVCPELEEQEKLSVQRVSSPSELKLKQKLAITMSKMRPAFDDLESEFAPHIFSYRSMLYCERTPARAESLRRIVCLHAINHIFKTRDRVIKNNARLVREEGVDLELRDQGFTRPKVLFILPTRESCVRMVKIITTLCEPEQQENRKRFDDAFLDEEEKFSTNKPEDFRELFNGNDDDMFRLGLKFTRKTIKFFSQFYNSDIIFASPLGLRMAIEGKDEKKRDSDFLSSIEVVVVDQADALARQNWEHMEYIFENLNLQPNEAHGCDFSRVRHWYLDNNARYFRQTITLTAFNTSEINALLFNQSNNWAGKVRINDAYQGSLQGLGLKVKQTFSRLDINSFSEDPEARFAYFTNAIVPSLTRRAKDAVGTLVFIPSYLDFVRIRNYFSTSATTSALSFGNISEYTSVPDAARARSHFLTGRHSVLLYTERAHHFRRYYLRGVKKVIMYGLPDNPIFYKEIVGDYLGRSEQEGRLNPGEASLRAVFSRWDLMKLERVVGTERVGKMIREKGDTFDFV